MDGRTRRRGGGGSKPAAGKGRRGDGESPEGHLDETRGELLTDSNGLTWRPLICLAEHGDGGVQGLAWYTTSLHQDTDGDVANDFFIEVLPAGFHAAECAPFPFPVPGAAFGI
ncbi:unnamed protein product [Closterium sp. Naga37s-1]|nr:unnamed protein product [Closterium sp. Naga37s-1]